MCGRRLACPWALLRLTQVRMTSRSYAQDTSQENGRIREQQETLIVYDDEYNQALPGDTWEDLEIQVTLDSGCVEHVMDAGEAPGYCVLERAGSKRKHHFVVGNGHSQTREKYISI